MYHINLRTLAGDLFNVFKGLSLFIFAEAFPVRHQSQDINTIRGITHILLCRRQNGQPWIRKFVVHRFKIVGQ